MPYLLDYLEHQLSTFEEEPFNVVDAAVLSQMCMIHGAGMVPALKERASFSNVLTVLQNVLSPHDKPARFLDLLRAEHFPEMFTGLDPLRIRRCLFAVAANPRFRTMTIRDYLSLFDIEQEMQFAAMTFVYGKEFAVVTFRGTDETITGWKEDFNMAYAAPVPAQEQALRYLTAVADRLPGKIFVNGHSKGGNLAEYVALKAPRELQDRIERVFILDGPGFKEGLFTPQDYLPLEGRLCKIVPQDSIVGLLLHSHAPVRVVPSNAKGFNQHSVFTWEIALKDDGSDPSQTLLSAVEQQERFELLRRLRERGRADGDNLTKAILEELAEDKPVPSYRGRMGNDFAHLDSVSDNADFMAETLRRWLALYGPRECKAVIDAMFRFLEAAGADDVLDLFSGGAKTLNLFAEAAANATEEDRELIVEAGKDFAETASILAATRTGKNVAESVKSALAHLVHAVEAGISSHHDKKQ